VSYIALYREWRPLTFDDVVEQEHIVKSLKYSVKSGRIAHAYLFCGTRGTGKTTMAQILSRAINCLNPQNGNPCNECDICKGILSGTILDVIEIDAASNNSVDNVRDLREDVVYTPACTRYKVYIIDEVHMLSAGAFNALLKTLEEPPSHVVFILATTEPNKLPATILSRCQRYDFRRITSGGIAARLHTICVAKGVEFEEEALHLIAGISDGALRDAISILDQCLSIGNGKLKYSDVISITGMADKQIMSLFADSLIEQNISKIISLVNQIAVEGKDISQFISSLILYFRDLLVCKLIGESPVLSNVLDVPSEILKTMNSEAQRLAKDEIVGILNELSDLESNLRWLSHPRISLEISLIKICTKILTQKSEPTYQIMDNIQPMYDQKPQCTVGSPVEQNIDITVAIWDNVLKELNKAGKNPLCSILRTAEIVNLNENCIGIVLPGNEGANKQIISQHDNIKLLENILKRELQGKDIKVKCLIKDDLKNIKKSIS